MESKFTVNICTRDRPSELALLLASLMQQTIDNWDLVIIDGSQMPVVQIPFLQQLFNELQMKGHKLKVAREELRGVCNARNQAVKLSDTDVVCRIDDDSWCEPDYLERLWKLMKEGADCAGGIVPLFGVQRTIRNSSLLNNIFNKIEFDEKGNLTKLGDDGGLQYYPNIILPSHHLRSSFMFKKSQWEEVGGYDTWTGFSGWREETLFCMKLWWAGHKKFITDTGAVSWHLRCNSGGVRNPDYNSQLAVLEAKFKDWAKLRYEVKGW